MLQFESDLQKLKIERLRSFKAIEDYMEAFERKRTQDLRVGVTPSVLKSGFIPEFKGDIYL